MRLLILSCLAAILLLSGCAEGQYKGELYPSHASYSPGRSSHAAYQGEQLPAVSTQRPGAYNGQSL